MDDDDYYYYLSEVDSFKYSGHYEVFFCVVNSDTEYFISLETSCPWTVTLSWLK